jgi:hypothetical protein
MAVTNEQFDQLKIDKLKYFLEDMQGKGQARPFEIFVDGLKVVPKTENPKDFDSYEYYMNEDTEKIRIIIYNTAHSPRNDQYTFLLKQGKTNKGLNGVDDVDVLFKEKLDARDKEHAMANLKEKLEETQTKLTEAEEYIEQLEEQAELAKSNKHKIGRLNLGEIAAIGFESMLRKNAHLFAKISGVGETFAGIIEQDTAEKNNRLLQPPTPTIEGEASFKKRTSVAVELTEQQQRHCNILAQLEQSLDEAQLDEVMVILEKIIRDPSQLIQIKTILKI